MLGLGCMGMSDFYGGRDEAEAIATIHAALDGGVDFLDTADMYGPFTNEILVGKALGSRRDEVIVATKFGNQRDESGAFLGINGRPEYVVSCCDASLQRLGIDTIDLYYQHRVDRSVPIEETIGAMAGLVDAGKVRFLGMSEASIGTLERACAIHPISALQTEYSLFSRDPEDGLIEACRRLKVGFVPYSPLGRGILTGAISTIDALEDGDYRRFSPRFSEDNLDENLTLVSKLIDLADEINVTPAQLALAWVLAQGEDIVPIPGTKRRRYLEENIGATAITLSPETLSMLSQAIPPGSAKGERYAAPQMQALNG
jgi:aryl-alcohol dehydrogenase-like predicted oxidoreductase